MRTRANITVAGLGVVVLLLAARAVMSAPERGPQWRPLSPAFTPGRDNIDGSYHTRLMRLRGRLDEVPDDTALLGELARLLQDAHQPGEAAVYYARYAAVAPDSRGAWLDLAASYAAVGEWTAAETAMRSMLDRFPADPAGSYNLGAILASQGRTTEATPWFEAAARSSDPESAGAARAALDRMSRK